MPNKNTDKNTAQKNKDLDKNLAFKGLTFDAPLKGGKQEKAEYTGFYAELIGTIKQKFVLKKSKNFSADNTAEVVTSSLLTSFIGNDNSVPYEFEKNKIEDTLYLKCQVRTDFNPLGSLLKGKKGLLHGWISSNPSTYKNKQNIQACFEDPEISKGGDPATLKKDMANVLAACLLVGDADCQVENIAFYTDKDSNRRIAKFDDGWGLANLCHPDNAKVDLFGSLKWYGDRATHKNSGLPTNHYIDYPFILHSVEFADSLKSVANKAYTESGNAVALALQKIDDAYESYSDSKQHVQAYFDFAKHLSIPLPEMEDLEVNEIRDLISIKLSHQLDKRAESMLILSMALKIKIKIDAGTYQPHSPEAEAIESALSEILKKSDHENVGKLLPNFDKANEPFKQTKEAKAQLKEVFYRVLNKVNKNTVQDKDEPKLESWKHKP